MVDEQRDPNVPQDDYEEETTDEQEPVPPPSTTPAVENRRPFNNYSPVDDMLDGDQ